MTAGQWIGQTAGRYKLVELNGAGAMGEVYRAEDPELGRDIAIEILHAGGSQPRLLREAQARAKLAHANVLRIHDVGTVDDRVFLARELVTGSTLRARFEASEWKPLVELIKSAGRGLAAAHAAGLVHGDFKPENVLVSNDGRVLVTDFGLAREHQAPVDGHVFAGTPAYMAPEQFEGKPATAASDQFSLCVTLFEALYGERPFQGSTEATLRTAHATLTFPAKPIPRHLVRLLRRGLSPDPAARFPALSDLLEDLEHSPRKLIGSTVGLLAAGAIAAILVSRSSSGPACAEAADLAGVWDDATRAKLAQAFERSGLPDAKPSLATIDSQLERYATTWSSTATETCRATARGAQSEALLDLRVQCLQRRRHELGALVEQLTGGDQDNLRDAVRAVLALPSVGACADVSSADPE